MAKRFIDTDLFRKPLVRSLQAPYKVLWVYLLCECDHAGVWNVEYDVAAMRLGVKIDPAKAVAGMQGAIVEIDGGRKWWIPEFVAFQYGTLNPANKVHASVLSILSKYGIDPENEGASKPLASPLEGAKDKDKDKEQDMDNSEKEHARKGPDPNVQGVIEHLTDRLKSEGIAQSLDGSAQDNRYAAKSLTDKLRKDYPNHDALTSAIALIDAAIADPFHRKNATNVRYLLNNCGKIAAAAKARKAETKNLTADEYGQAIAQAAAERLRARQADVA